MFGKSKILFYIVILFILTFLFIPVQLPESQTTKISIAFVGLPVQGISWEDAYKFMNITIDEFKKSRVVDLVSQSWEPIFMENVTLSTSYATKINADLLVLHRIFLEPPGNVKVHTELRVPETTRLLTSFYLSASRWQLDSLAYDLVAKVEKTTGNLSKVTYIIESDPPEALVTIDGDIKGHTKLVYKIVREMGITIIEVSKPPYKEKREREIKENPQLIEECFVLSKE